MSATLTIERKPEIKTEVETISFQSYWLLTGEYRLDGSFYTEETQKAFRLLKGIGYKTTNIEELSKEVFNPPPIKREYSGREGTPYLTPTEIFQLRLKPSKYVYAKKMNNIEDWFVKGGWVLITQSGRVGMPYYVTKPLEKFVVSQNVIRIIPQKDVYSGFLYAYLSSWIGQTLATRDQFGVTVEHIRPHHVQKVSVPIFPDEIQKQIHNNIKKSYELRDKARILLNEAEEKMHRELRLPRLEDYSRETKVFTKNVSRLSLRLDSSYHDPIVDDLIRKIDECGETIASLGEVSEVYLPSRFKRIYVGKEFGIPFLQASDIHQIRPRLLKYLSKKVTKHIENYIVKSGWILVTRSGTVGRVSLVPKRWEGWTVSEHVFRIFPCSIHAGYLTCFLDSQYGYHQIVSKIYGGVVDEISGDDLEKVQVPMPSSRIQEKIGKLVLEAYELKELANKIEDETVKTLEDMFSSHRKIEVNEEYLKEINAYADSFDLIGDEEFRENLEELESGETTSFDDFKKEHGF